MWRRIVRYRHFPNENTLHRYLFEDIKFYVFIFSPLQPMNLPFLHVLIIPCLWTVCTVWPVFKIVFSFNCLFSHLLIFLVFWWFGPLVSFSSELSSETVQSLLAIWYTPWIGERFIRRPLPLWRNVDIRPHSGWDSNTWAKCSNGWE
jgi:hypothetical protein